MSGAFCFFGFFWLLQDLLTVFTASTVRMPEIFLLSLVYKILTADRDAYVPLIWTAFFGGLLWDMRWVGIPFFSLSYVAAALIVMSAWNTIPSAGRTAFVIFFLFWSAQLLPAVLSVLTLERETGSLNWDLFAVQQGCAVPVSLLSVFFYFHHGKDRNA